MTEQQADYNIETVKKENAALRKYAAIQKAFEDKIGCQKVYVNIAGGIEEAFIIDELIFFTLPRVETGKSGLRVRKNGFLWMAVSRTEWWHRKRITPKQADGAIERLVKSGLVFRQMFLFNKQKTTHLRLNVPEFFRRYIEELDRQNPPEEEGDTLVKDIQDLYEMMGIPKGDTPEGVLKGNTGVPFKEKVSPNGDSINNPHTTLTQPSDIYMPDPVFLALENLKGGLNSETPRFVDMWREKHNDEWILKAVAMTREKGAGIKYTDAILVGWEANGYPKTREERVEERKQSSLPKGFDVIKNWLENSSRW